MTARLFASLRVFTLEDVQNALNQEFDCDVLPRGKTRKVLLVRTQGVLVMEANVFDDIAKQVPNNSYDPPPLWYVDKDFVCVECGTEETWTAAQQKWYYEEAKGTLYATAKRCYTCRLQIREAKAQQREQMAASKKADAGSNKRKSSN